VLGYTPAEVAGMLDTTETAVKGALQRARAALPAAAAPGREVTAEERELSGRFAAAFVARDLDGLLALLTDDAWLAMPPAPHEYHGPAAIAGFLKSSSTWRDDLRLRLVPAAANRQPAYGCYLDGRPAGIVVLTVRADRIGGLTRFLDERLFDRFGLPGQVG